jgi:hypothetical protein
MTDDTPPPVLTLEAMNRPPWGEAALSLPLPKEPSLALLDEAGSQVIEFLDWVTQDLARIAGPDQIRAEITRAAERLIEISLERAAVILAERLQRGFSDAALDLHVVARGIK